MIRGLFETRRLPLLILPALAIWPLPAAAIPDGRYEFSEVHMGMPVRLVLYAGGEAQARQAASSAFARVRALDGMLSDYRVDSEVRRLAARSGEWVPVSEDLMAVVTRAVEIARVTDGAFDPTVGPLVALWREARRTKRLPAEFALADARRRVGWQFVELDRERRAIRLKLKGMQLDLGGIAKGYILQEALRTLGGAGINRALAEAGGDLVVGDAPPGRAGWAIEAPGAAPEFAARAGRLRHEAIATSGPTSQFVEIDGVRYSHVIDPRRGLGVTHDVVARVIAPDAATADALATALSVLGPEGVPAIQARWPTAVIEVSIPSPKTDWERRRVLAGAGTP